MKQPGRWLILLLLIPLLSACRAELYSQVSERDANEILAALYAAGIEAHKRTSDRKVWSVEVSESKLQQALQIVAARGLPREQFTNTGEVFKKEGLISTPSEERIRYIFALSQELGRTLSEIDGVVAARVHPVIPANDPLASRVRPSSASVFIKHRRNADLQALAPTIRNLVLRGIEGLEYENIALTFVAAEEPLGPMLETGTPASTSVESGGGMIGGIGLLLVAIGALGYLGYGWVRWRPIAAKFGPRMAPPAEAE